MIDRLRDAYLGLGFGSTAEFESVLAPDVEFVDHVLSEERAVRGRDQLARLLDGFAEAWEALSYEPERFVPAGDRIAVVLCVTGQSRQNGEPVIERIGQLLELRQGRVARITSWPDPQTALDAVDVEAGEDG